MVAALRHGDHGVSPSKVVGFDREARGRRGVVESDQAAMWRLLHRGCLSRMLRVGEGGEGPPPADLVKQVMAALERASQRAAALDAELNAGSMRRSAELARQAAPSRL